MASPALQSTQVIQVNLTGIFDSQHCVCTFAYYVNVVGTGSTAVLADVPTKWNDAYWKFDAGSGTPGLSEIFMPGVTSVGVGAQIVYGPGARSLMAFQAADPNTGQWATGNPLTSGACLVIKKTGLKAGPKYRGRVYTFGLPQALTINSNINPAHDDTLTSIMERLDADMSWASGAATITLTPCIHSVNTAPTIDQIGVTHTWNSAVRYQRRREVGVGQ